MIAAGHLLLSINVRFFHYSYSNLALQTRLVDEIDYRLVSFSAGRRPAEAYRYDRGCFFSPEFGHRLYQSSGTYRRVFLFHQNLVTDHTKIQGHTGGSSSFTRIWSPTVPKFRDIQEGLSFSPEFGHRPYQNSGTYRRVFLFHQNLVTYRTKDQGHTGGSFFFTRILKKKHLLKM
jgi:hypothetical protein